MREILEIPSGKWKLHGMAHIPAETRGRRIGVVVVVGPTPKFGTHRLLLQVAETLAQEGFYSLRYDSRGTCDSQGICDLTFADRIADARATVTYFRQRYRLDAVFAWGLCISGAVSLHASAGAKKPEEKFDGLILCNLLSHPSQAQQLPQLAYGRLDLQTAAKNIFMNENPLRKLWKVVRRSENWLKKGPTLMRRLVRPEQVLDQLRQAAPRVGELLAGFDGPTLLVFGEKDRYWDVFRDQVNPGDRLGLGLKKLPPAWAFVKDGDHTFSSREQTAVVLRYTLDWVKPFLQGTVPGPVHSTLQLWQHNTEATETAWR
jgi:alpha-beta hydrolase superfamily lysophospholipase